jgi:hypothetical protein
MAAMFFQGTLGSFAPGSAFDRGSSQRGPYAQQVLPQGPWASGTHLPTGASMANGTMQARQESATSQALGRQPVAIGAAVTTSQPDAIKQGTASRG